MPKLSQDALDERRQHILAAAARCFEREGFHRTTIADVRREAKVSTGAVYTYFPNKEAIIQAMLEDAQAARRAVLRKSAGGAEGASPDLVLLQWVANVFTADGLRVSRVDMNLWAESVRNPAVARLAKTAIREATRTVGDVIGARAPKGARLPKGVASNDIAAILVSILLGLEVQAAVGIRLEPNTVVKALLALLSVKAPTERDLDRISGASTHVPNQVKTKRSPR